MIAELNLAIAEKTEQVNREKNNAFLTSRMHGKQVVAY
jgi:hypothetical protein